MDPSLDRAPSRRLLIALSVLALAGLVVGIRLFTSAFPEASIEFKISRSDAVVRASEVLNSLGYPAGGYNEAIVFDYDELAKTYLEREIGLERSGRLMKSDISIWRWKYRRFRPLQREEFLIYLDTSGRLAGYRHAVEEAAKGASLEGAQAREVAEAFLRDKVALPLDQYALVEEQSVERPERRDHILTWERKGFKAGEATYRARVTVQGGEVGGYDEYLKIPEGWQRSFQEMRSHNDLLQNAATFLFVLVFLAMLVTLFTRLHRGQWAWRLPTILGATMFVLQFLQGLNRLPLSLIHFDTTLTMGSFVLSNLGFIFLEATGSALLVFVSAAAGEPLYRRYFPDKLSMQQLFSRSATGTVEFAQGTLVGYLFVMVHFGFITAFYYYGKGLGFWSPAEVNYTDAVSTAIPWITPLALSFNASLFEEFTFRLFAIPFFKRYLKSTWLAIVIPAFLWGFLHSSYPQEPSFVRGLEVGVIGVAAGWIMLRYGIWATLVWHYVVDAFLIGLFLFRSNSLYFQVSGAVVVGGLLVPLVVAIAVRWKRGAFVDPSPLTNAAQEREAPEASGLSFDAGAAPAAASSDAPDLPHAPVALEAAESVSLRFRPAPLALLALAGLAAVLLLRVERFGDFAEFRINAAAAAGKSDAHLRSLGVDPAAFRRNTELINVVSDLTPVYIYRQEGVKRLNQAYAADLPGLLWKTRYFKPLDKEEYWVSYTIQGNYYNYRHLMDEKAPGANPSRDEALSRATAYLKTAKDIEVSAWKLVHSENRKRDARTDYDFEWERETGGIGEARFRVGVAVVGGEVQGFQSTLKLPESWELKERETTVLRALVSHAPTTLGVFFFVALLALFILRLRSGGLRWQGPVKLGLALTAGIFLLYANSISTIVGQYPTQFQYGVYWATMVLVLLILMIMSLAGIAMLLSLALSMLELGGYRERFWPREACGRRRVLACGILAGYALTLGFAGFSKLLGYVLELLGWHSSTPVLSVLQSAGDAYPLAGSLLRSVLIGAIGLALAICLMVFLTRLVPSRGRRLFMIGLGVVLSSGGEVRTAADALIPLAVTALTLALMYQAFQSWIGWNPAAFGIWLFLRSFGGEALYLAQQPDGFFRWAGIAGAVLCLVPLLLAYYWYRGSASNPQAPASDVVP